MCRTKSNMKIHGIIFLPDLNLLFAFDFSLFWMRVWHADPPIKVLLSMQGFSSLTLSLSMTDKYVV